MMARGVLAFQYEAERADTGVTALGGFPLYLELFGACGLWSTIKREMSVCGLQGWLDGQMVVSALCLNFAGGDCVDDLERLERDGGFTSVLGVAARCFLSRRERRELRRRWRRVRGRTVPSGSSMLAWLGCFHDAAAAAGRVAGTAFIPALSAGLRALWRVNDGLVGFLQGQRCEQSATLDMDATLIESHKREALPCYKGCRACQPLNCWWAELGVMLHWEFRDGNVPAGFEQLRVLKECLGKASALGVETVCLRSAARATSGSFLCIAGKARMPGSE